MPLIKHTHIFLLSHFLNENYKTRDYFFTVVVLCSNNYNQAFAINCCCKGWHSQLLDLEAITFSRSARQVWTAFLP